MSMLIESYFLLEQIIDKLETQTGITFELPSQDLFTPQQLLDILRWIDKTLDRLAALKHGEGIGEGEGDEGGSL